MTFWARMSANDPKRTSRRDLIGARLTSQLTSEALSIIRHEPVTSPSSSDVDHFCANLSHCSDLQSQAHWHAHSAQGFQMQLRTYRLRSLRRDVHVGRRSFNSHLTLVTSCRAADYGGAEVPVKGQRKCRRQAHNSQQTSTFRSECVSRRADCARAALFLQQHQQRGVHTWRPTRSLSTTNL